MKQVFYVVQICYKYEDDMILLFKKYDDALRYYRRECQNYGEERKIVLKKFDLSIGRYDSETTIEKNRVD